MRDAAGGLIDCSAAQDDNDPVSRMLPSHAFEELSAMRMNRRLRAVLSFGAVGLAFIGALCAIRAVGRAQWESRKAALLETIESAQPLIDALRQYETAHGHPPARLDDLVPSFIGQIPSPGGPAHGEWEYWASTPGGRIEGGKWHRVRLDSTAGGWALGIAVRKGFRPVLIYDIGDYFVFHPSGVYPVRAYGGVLERVGSWGYYRE